MPPPNKKLPPTPPSDGEPARITPLTNAEKSYQRPTPMYSSETYTRLLEQENEQLRLRNKQLQLRIACLEGKVDIHAEDQVANQRRASYYKDALQRRDKIVGEIAEAIINEFQRYKEYIEEAKGGEEITVYSQFDESPI